MDFTVSPFIYVHQTTVSIAQLMQGGSLGCERAMWYIATGIERGD